MTFTVYQVAIAASRETVCELRALSLLRLRRANRIAVALIQFCVITGVNT